MKFIWRLILIISIAILYIGYAHPDWIVDPALAINVSDKYDGDCQPSETAGRCADKCPADSYLQGYDKTSGSPVCKPNGQTDPSESNVSQSSPADTPQPTIVQSDTFKGK